MHISMPLALHANPDAILAPAGGAEALGDGIARLQLFVELAAKESAFDAERPQRRDESGGAGGIVAPRRGLVTTMRLEGVLQDRSGKNEIAWIQASVKQIAHLPACRQAGGQQAQADAHCR
ncbi:MAG TPA: hypothetical protein VIK47_02485 [Kiloniellales bacterium]